MVLRLAAASLVVGIAALLVFALVVPGKEDAEVPREAKLGREQVRRHGPARKGMPSGISRRSDNVQQLGRGGVTFRTIRKESVE